MPNVNFLAFDTLYTNALDGTDELPFVDDLTKYTRLPWHDTDEHKQIINKSIQCLGQLPIKGQIVGALSKLYQNLYS